MGLTEEMIDEAVENYANSDTLTEAEKLALRLSELMATHPGAAGGEFYERLSEHYTEQEIVELGVFIGFNVGYHTFFATLDFYPMFSPDGRLITQEESRRIYGDKPASHLRGPLARAHTRGAPRNTAVALIQGHEDGQIPQKGTEEVLRRCRDLHIPDDLFIRILVRVPGYARAILDAMYTSHAEGNVDHRLKEIIRVQLARRAGDTYFADLRSAKAKKEGLTEELIQAGCGDFEADPRFTVAEKWALRYAWLMYREPQKLDKPFYDEGKRHWSEAQIMELGAMIALHYGMQTSMRTFCLFPLRGPGATTADA